MVDYSKIPSLLLLIISILICLFSGVIGNLYSKKYISNNQERLFYCIVTQSVTVVSLIVLSGFSFKCSLYTFVMAILFGFLITLQSVMSLNALAIGLWSYTAVLGSFSTVITAFSGYLFWNEKLPPVKIFGVILMTVCVILSVSKEKETKKTSLKWLLYVLMSSISNACIGLLQKTHQKSEYKGELSQFLIVAFIVATIFSVISFFSAGIVCKKSNDTEKTIKKGILRPILICGMLLVGICAALNNEFNLYLSGVMDSAVFFPMVNGGGLILSIVVSVIAFREKLSAKQWGGIFMGVVAAFLLCK